VKYNGAFRNPFIKQALRQIGLNPVSEQNN